MNGQTAKAKEQKDRQEQIEANRRLYELLLTKPQNKYAHILGVELDTKEIKKS